MRRSIAIAALLATVLVLPVASVAWAGQTLFGQKSVIPILQYNVTQPSTSAVNYIGLTQGGAPWNATESVGQGVIGGDSSFEFSHWTINIPSAPSAGKSWAFKLRKNGADTSLGCTIADAATTCTDSTNYALFSPGDQIDVAVTPSGTPSAWTPPSTWAIQYQSKDARKSLLLVSSGNGQTLAAATTTYQQVDMGGMFGTERDESEPQPEGGTVSAMYATTDVDPGNTKALVGTFRVNEADTALTCTITGNGTNATTCSDTDPTHAVSFNAGDRIGWKWVNAAGAATCRPRAGAMLRYATDGRSFLGQGATQAINTNQYQWSGQAPTNTEANVKTVTAAGTIRNLYFNATTAAFAALTNASEVVTVALRVNAADSALTCSITPNSSVIQCTDTTHAVSVSAGDLIDIRVQVANAGVTIWGAWGLEWDAGLTPFPPQFPLTGVGENWMPDLQLHGVLGRKRGEG